MQKICPVCNRKQCEMTGIWIAINDSSDDPEISNYYMCSDCYEEGRRSYRESISKVQTDKNA